MLKNIHLYHNIKTDIRFMKISKRKFEHIQVVLEKDIQFRKKTTGFEDYDFIHCALPEIDYTDIHTQTEFFQKTLSFPLLISAMTGGYNGALNINRQLAEICQSEKLALGVGSQRQLIESNDFNDSYRIVRKMAPDSIIIGNIGAAQLTEFKNYAPKDQID